MHDIQREKLEKMLSDKEIAMRVMRLFLINPKLTVMCL